MLSEALLAGLLKDDEALAYPALSQAADEGCLNEVGTESEIRLFMSIRRTLLEVGTAKRPAERTAAYAAVDARERSAGMTSRPLDALDVRTRLVETLQSIDGRHLAMRATQGMRSAFASDPADEFIGATTDDLDRLTALLQDEATTFWIAPDLVDLVVRAAQSMPAQPLVEGRFIWSWRVAVGSAFW